MREATFNDKEIVINIISKSFDENQSVNYVVKQDRDRKKRIALLMKYSFFYGYNFGKIYISEDDKAACILLFSDRKKVTLKSIIWDIKLATKCIGVFRVEKVLKRESAIKKNHPKKPFIHLWYIGVDPMFQNKGVGSKLLNEILLRYPKKLFYLETSTATNIPFYEKFGFKTVEKIDLGYMLNILKKE